MWRDFNALRPHRPMVLAFPEGGWRDLLDESDLECEDPLLRRWELGLRRTIWRHQHIHDDHPVVDFFNVGWVVERGDYGLRETIIRADPDGAFRWDSPVKTAEDVKRLRFRGVHIRRRQTERNLQLAQEVLGDILRVRLHGGLYWSVGMTWTLICLRGLQQVMIDMYENPGIVHDIMGLLRDSTLREIETFQQEGILSLNNGPDDYVGSGAIGCTDELPGEDFNGRVRTKDLWVLGESQEFVGVGPEQFYEFALQYQLPLMNRFGLVCYGCCEPLDRKFDLILRHIPRLRRVSVSPWCDRAVAAEKLAGKYVYSWKPNPAMICAGPPDYELVEKTVRETLDIARGCCVEIVMKDTHTFQGDAGRIERWSRIASRVAAESV